jgi:cytidine deaminase
MSARPETDFVENARRPELIFGLIGALGTDILAVEGVIRDRVTQFGYSVPETIKLTDLFGALSDSRFASVQHGSTKASIEAKMDAGNLLRQITERGEAMAMLGINRIRVIRAAQVAVNGGSPAKTAFIVNSLKHPNEVRSLRRIYGSAFVAVAIYGERAARILATQVRLADFHGSGEPSRYEADAVKLVNRDQDEQLNPYGQHVGEAFALADVVVAASLGRDLKQSTERFLDDVDPVQWIVFDWGNHAAQSCSNSIGDR